MTDLEAMRERIQTEERAGLLDEYEQLLTASRLYQATEQAVAARYAGLARLPVETHLRLVRGWTR